MLASIVQERTAEKLVDHCWNSFAMFDYHRRGFVIKRFYLTKRTTAQGCRYLWLRSARQQSVLGLGVVCVARDGVKQELWPDRRLAG